jgi:hypothetical protein
MATKFTARDFEAVDLTRGQPKHGAVRMPQQQADQPASSAATRPERRRAVNRRGSAWRAFLYGNFRPRRRDSRRKADSHHYLFDWHEPRILYLTLGILLLSCLDALFTLNLLHAGATEANIIMAKMLDHSVDKFIAVKIVVTTLSLMIMMVGSRRQFIGPVSVEHLLQAFCFGYLVVICYEIYLFKFIFNLSILPID